MPHITKGKKRNTQYWIVDARDIGGGQKYFKTEKEAIAKLREWTHDDVEGKFIPSAQDVQFYTALSEWLKTNKQRLQIGDIGAGEYGNMITSCNHILKFDWNGQRIHHIELSEMKTGRLAKIIIPQIRAGRAHASAKKLLVHFKSIFKDAVLSEFIAYDPARDLKLPKLDGEHDVEDVSASRKGQKSLAERIASDNVQKIIEAAGEKYRRQIEVIAFTGVRVGELRAATWDQINFGDDKNGATFTIDRAVKKGGNIGDPKTYSGFRTIPLDDYLATLLREWKLSQPIEQRNNNLIFPNREGGVADGDNWRNRGIEAACKTAEVEYVSLRDLRHHFASILIFDGAFTEATVTELMGHTDINFTKKQYATWLKSGKRDKELGQKLTALRRAQ